MPVYSLLGGRTRHGALAYTHVGGRDFAEVEDGVRKAMARGFRVIRAQVAVPGATSTYGAGGAAEAASATWASPDGDGMPAIEANWDTAAYLRRIPRLFEHLRAAVGEEVHLLHDVHERLTPVEACRLARDLESARLFFLEDPLRPEHAPSFRLLRQASSTPIAMGELYTSKYECLPVVTEQLVDFIRCDLGHIGGLTEARKIAAICEPYQVMTAWHGPGDIGPPTHAANVHLDCAIPNFGVQEMAFFTDAVHEVCPGAPVYTDGYLMPSERPGLGVDLDEEAAGRYPYRRAYLPMVRRADGSLHDW
jgi:mannonate dehydratase